jgi:hypothetical protein
MPVYRNYFLECMSKVGCNQVNSTLTSVLTSARVILMSEVF